MHYAGCGGTRVDPVPRFSGQLHESLREDIDLAAHPENRLPPAAERTETLSEVLNRAVGGERAGHCLLWREGHVTTGESTAVALDRAIDQRGIGRKTLSVGRAALHMNNCDVVAGTHRILQELTSELLQSQYERGTQRRTHRRWRVQQQDVRASFGHVVCRGVRDDIGTAWPEIGHPGRNGKVDEREGPHGLRPAVFHDFEVVFGEIADRIALAVGDDDVHLDLGDAFAKCRDVLLGRGAA